MITSKILNINTGSITAVPRKLATSVTFEPEVIAYLDYLAKQEERTRSQVINRIIKKHASQHKDDMQTRNQNGPKTS